MIKTKKPVSLIIFALLITAPLIAAEEKTGLIVNKPAACNGYTLFAPLGSNSTYLIDMQGRVVNSWQSDYRPGQSAYLLENGNLLRTASMGPMNQTFQGGGAAGRVQEFTWDGNLVWDFEYASDKHLSHHDIARLPNGNVLMVAWETKTAAQAIAAGRDPDVQGDADLWPDHIIEVKPTGKTTGKVVWQWHVWDHLIQDLDPRRENFGKVAEHPELININPLDWTTKISSSERKKLESLGYLRPSKQENSRHGSSDLNHTNAIAYNAQLDQIALSVLGYNEVWIIDHSTTTEEAASHTGGKSGKGGDLLYRWGNPVTYKAGDPTAQQLFAQHDAHWIPDGCDGAGNLLVFNNGRSRPEGNYSSIVEIVPPVDSKGNYSLKAGKAFAPAKPKWTYTAKQKEDFYSGHISGCQRLPNGNTLICSGEDGTIFEVTPDKQIVWKYINPVQEQRGPGRGNFQPGRNRPGGNFGDANRPPMPGPGMDRPDRGAAGMPGPGMGGPGKGGPSNTLFRAYRYTPGYPGLKDRDLTPGKTVEQLAPKQSDIQQQPNMTGQRPSGRRNRTRQF